MSGYLLKSPKPSCALVSASLNQCRFCASVCKTVRPMLSDRCPVSLSVCLSCLRRALWPNGWTDQDETWHAGLGPGHIVLDRDPAPPPQRGTAANFRPILLQPNGCMDQDATLVWRYRPRPRRLCDRWRPIIITQQLVQTGSAQHLILTYL